LKEIHRSDRNTIFGALESIGSALFLSSRGKRDLPQGADSSYRQNYKRDSISLNIDFILGLPFVKPGETLAGIQELHARFPYITHTSVYMLEDEKYPKHWRANSITEDEMQSEFLAIVDYLESIGWHHYELSNWARP
jgi:coproporphyrinogen III oxidase-like Fe-S oxidoreductase